MMDIWIGPYLHTLGHHLHLGSFQVKAVTVNSLTGNTERKEEKEEEKVEEVKAEAPKEAAPKKTTKASTDKADNLTKIEGIGPKAAEALANANMETYAKLAKAKADEIKEILTAASSRMAHLDPTSWPKQAKMAAEGKWDELSEWQDNAKGGVE